jgi:type II secretory ATPase GspE/PulE/Tfp pilus assembly ATPase PilB-like protein
LTRLIDMGIDDYVVASSLTAVVAQRLVRKVCSTCGPRTSERDDRMDEDTARTWTADPACPRCDGLGYSGRQGVFETVAVTSALRALMLAGADAAALQEHARADGTRTLREAAEAAADKGLTTRAEAARVTAAHDDL